MNGFSRTLKAAMARARESWQQRPVHEQRLALFAVAVLAPLLVIFGVLLPLRDRIAALEKRVDGMRVQVAAMRDMQARISRSGGQVTAVSPLPADIVSRLRDSLAAHGDFRGTLARNDRGVELLIEHVRFDALLAWLSATARRDGLVASELRVAGTGDPGIVAGRLQLSQGGGR
jgi:type II secretory pathway component PulM